MYTTSAPGAGSTETVSYAPAVRRGRGRRAPGRVREERGRSRPVQAYADIARLAPLLNAEDEVRLARAVRDHGCTDSRERLICSNLRLVVYMAKRFAGRGPGMADLIAEGVVGLVRAVDGYDPEVGTRFSTYAVWWIGQAMRVAVMRDTPIVHVPAYMFGRMANCRKSMRALERRLGRAPSPDEVRRDMDVSPRYMRAVQHAMDACGPRMPWVNKGQDATLGDRVADERESGAETMIVRDETARHLRDALESLDGRSAEVVAMRFGLDGRESRTLSEIAVAIGTSRERVRQITNCALRALHAKLSQ